MKQLIIILLFLCFSFEVFAGIQVKGGSKKYKDSPSDTVDTVNYFGLGVDFGIPFIGVDLVGDVFVGQKVDTSVSEAEADKLSFTETRIGIKKEFLTLVKPFVSIGTSNNTVTYENSRNGKSEKDEASYSGTWYSAGVKLALLVVQAGIEYRQTSGAKVAFSNRDNATEKVDLSSSSTIYSFGFGFGF